MRRFFGPTGSVSRITIESRALENNLLGDPLVRVVDIYLPAGHDGEGLPLLVDLVGFTGSGLSHTNWVGFRENLPERLDRLIGEQKMPPVVGSQPAGRHRKTKTTAVRYDQPTPCSGANIRRSPHCRPTTRVGGDLRDRPAARRRRRATPALRRSR